MSADPRTADALTAGTAAKGAPTAGAPGLSILHLHLELGEESCANQFCLPSPHKVAIGTLFPPALEVPSRINLFAGDGTVRGFMRVLREALAADEYDLVHAHGPIDGFLLLAHRLLSRGRLPPLVFTAHHSFTNSNLKIRNRLLMIPVFAAYDRIICVGRASLDSFPALYRWLARGRLSAVPNGVNLARIDDRARQARRAARGPDGRFTVVSVGRLIAIKNPLAVLAAFERGAEPPSRLLYVGGGALEDDLTRAVARSRRSADVTLLGRIRRESVYDTVADADLFVSASRGEGMPMAVLEAMACRVPVVLSDIAPHREIAADAPFIPLVAADDVNGFADQIRRFGAMSSSDRRRIGELCRGVVERRFSLQRMLGGYDSVYMELLAGVRKGGNLEYRTRNKEFRG